MADETASAKPDDKRFGLDAPQATAHHRDASDHHGHGKSGIAALTLGALGVVYGDIGTSPLYALRETINAAVSGNIGSHGGSGSAIVREVPRDIVIGVLSLILWSLVFVVTIKYVIILLRADNNGEGGTLTLVALAQRAVGKASGNCTWRRLCRGVSPSESAAWPRPSWSVGVGSMKAGSDVSVVIEGIGELRNRYE